MALRHRTPTASGGISAGQGQAEQEQAGQEQEEAGQEEAGLPEPASQQSAASGHRGRFWPAVRVAISGIAALALLGGAIVAWQQARTEQTRKPTAAELSAAAQAGLVQHWERVAAGVTFPAGLGYDSDQGGRETATRVGIAAGSDCTTAIDRTLAALVAQYRCRAAVRASYTDQLSGTVYTIGVLAFPSAAAAQGFYEALPQPAFPAAGLHALALPGTAAARFTDAARQLSAAAQAGPYAVLAVAGYADGRPAAATGERRDSAFSSASQLAEEVLPGSPAAVNCADTAEWSC